MLMLFLFGLCTPMILWIAFEIFICTQEKVIKKVLQKTVGGKNRVVDKVLGVSSPKTSKLKAFGKNIHAKTSKIEKGVEDLARWSKDALKGTIHFIKGVVRVSIFITTNFALFGVLINIMLSLLLLTAATNSTIIAASSGDGFTLANVNVSSSNSSSETSGTSNVATSGTANAKIVQVAESYCSVSASDSKRLVYNRNRGKGQVDCSSFVIGCVRQATGYDINGKKNPLKTLLNGTSGFGTTSTIIADGQSADGVVGYKKGGFSSKEIVEKAIPGDILVCSTHAVLYYKKDTDSSFYTMEAMGISWKGCSDTVDGAKKAATSGNVLTFGYSHSSSQKNDRKYEYIIRMNNIIK